jgi:hypothetical protein
MLTSTVSHKGGSRKVRDVGGNRRYGRGAAVIGALAGVRPRLGAGAGAAARNGGSGGRRKKDIRIPVETIFTLRRR